MTPTRRLHAQFSEQLQWNCDSGLPGAVRPTAGAPPPTCPLSPQQPAGQPDQTAAAAGGAPGAAPRRPPSPRPAPPARRRWAAGALALVQQVQKRGRENAAEHLLQRALVERWRCHRTPTAGGEMATAAASAEHWLACRLPAGGGVLLLALWPAVSAGSAGRLQGYEELQRQ